MEKTKFEKLKEFAASLLKFGTEETQEEKDAKAKAEADKEPAKFDAVKIKDGETMVEYNPSLEVGSPVMISTGTGSTDAPDNTYSLSNGVVFIVKDGKIESVTDNGELDENKTAEAMSAKIVKLESELATLQGLFAKIDFDKIPTKDEIVKFNSDVQKFGAQIGEVISELSAIPVNIPTSVEPEAAKVQGINFEAVAAKFASE